MVYLLDYDDIAEFWPEWRDWSTLRHMMPQRNAHNIIKKMWDGKDRPNGMEMKHTLLSYLAVMFPDDANNGRPMGDFKDLMDRGLTHEDAFNDLKLKLVKPRRNKNGKRISFLDQLWRRADNLYWDYFQTEKYGKWITEDWSRQLYTDAMVLMMFSSTVGIFLEDRAHRDLSQWLKRYPKAHEIFKYEPAPSSMEKLDVDGIFRHRKTGEIVVKVSIKSVGAFTEEFISKGYRNNTDKAKTAPDIYAGYKEMDDLDIQFILVDDKDLKTLLKESL